MQSLEHRGDCYQQQHLSRYASPPLLVGRAFSGMLFGLSPADPLSLLGASSVLPSRGGIGIGNLQTDVRNALTGGQKAIENTPLKTTKALSDSLSDQNRERGKHER